MYLAANQSSSTIVEGNQANQQQRASAIIIIIIFLRKHIDESLKNEYLTIEDPYVLWIALKKWFDNQKTVILSHASFEWINLLLQDYKFVAE